MPSPSSASGTAVDGAPVPFRLGHRRCLDGLRGVAVLAVLAGHLHLLPGGFLGVDIFFVLSGFLITTLLVEEWQRRDSIHLPRFYLRRALRLCPPLFALLAVGLVYTLVCRPAAEAAEFRREMVFTACYVSNFARWNGVPMLTLGHTWSLAVEEQFYLLWPALLYGMFRLGLSRTRAARWACAGVLAAAGLRLLLHRVGLVSGGEKLNLVYRLYTGLDTRADALLIGCVVGLLATSNRLPRSPRAVFWLGAASLACTAGLVRLMLTKCWDHAQFYDGLFTLVALMVAVILVRLLAAPSRLGALVLESAPLVGAGRISYALYLAHMPIIVWLHPAALGWQAPGNTLLVAGLSVAAAVLSFHGVERPCLRLKRWLTDTDAARRQGPLARSRSPDRKRPEAADA